MQVVVNVEEVQLSTPECHLILLAILPFLIRVLVLDPLPVVYQVTIVVHHHISQYNATTTYITKDKWVATALSLCLRGAN
jgi:hypothetical protein